MRLLWFPLCSATFDRIAEINFNLDADDNSVSVPGVARPLPRRPGARFDGTPPPSLSTQANAAAFEACCKERICQFDDTEEEEDIWEEKEMNYATQAKSRTRWTPALLSCHRSQVQRALCVCRHLAAPLVLLGLRSGRLTSVGDRQR